MDSDKLKYFVRLSTLQVKVNGTVSASLALEMIEYIRQLEAISQEVNPADGDNNLPKAKRHSSSIYGNS